MHPADVAELVADQVEELRAKARQLGADDAIDRIELADAVDLFIEFRARAWSSTATQATSPILLPGGAYHATVVNIPIVGSAADRTLVLHADCSDYDGQAPVVDLVDGRGVPLPAASWPRDPTGRGIVANHRAYQRPFFCRPGTREFHQHPQHEDEPWDRFREGLTLSSILLPIVNDLQHRWIL